jgi:predicted amidohydrolase
MRILPAALNVPKGDLGGNLRRHVALLEQGLAEGCDLVVFPEFSLTGSVDPRRHPQRALAVDAEQGYRTGNGAGVFELGAARFGITLCAEGGVDFPWTGAAEGGASVVSFCAAPGLYGRRTDEQGWRDGHAWWLSCGLGDAVRHARRLGLPVAMTTQAGSTEDEDFPGLAALVSPTGEVVRLPDWRPGSRVVDLPLQAS